MCQSGLPSRSLSLPTHVSISTVCCGVRTMNVWILDARSPVVSSKKCGLSHTWCLATASGVESGSIEVVGNEERPISTTEVMVTSLSWMAGAVVVMGDTLPPPPSCERRPSVAGDCCVELERRPDRLHGALRDT